MDEPGERALFERYSQGALTRRELEKALGRDLPFGDALLRLYDFGLPLPRPAYDPDSPGSRVLRTLLREGRHG